MKKIAVLSDIHGNYNALKAVVKEAENEKVNEYWLLGDIFLPGPGGKNILNLLDQLPITAKVRGNWDDCFLSIIDGEKLSDASDIYLAKLSQYLFDILSENEINQIRDMPLNDKKRINGINFSLSHNQLNKNWGGALMPCGAQSDFDSLFANKDIDVAIYAHTHHQLMRYDIKDRLILNPGTVGQPFSFWDNYVYDQRAQFMILEISNSGLLNIEFKKVEYDTEKEVKLAKQANLPYFNLYQEQINTGVTHTHDLETLTRINKENNYDHDVLSFLSELSESYKKK